MSFDFKRTEIPDVLVITPERFRDRRGHFLETFRTSAFAHSGLELGIAQVNESVSGRGTLRGLHYQRDPHAQGKLVRVLRGAVTDVAVDIRSGSPWYGRHVARRLSADNGGMMWIPPGFAHGFCALEDHTHFLYLQTAEYRREAEGGCSPLDPALAIEWPLGRDELVLSDKDLGLPPLAETAANFVYHQPDGDLGLTSR